MAIAAHPLIVRNPAASDGSRMRTHPASVTPATAAFGLACLSHVAGLRLGPGAQVALLAVAVLFSLPHGGADLVVGSRLVRPRLGRNWLLVFGLAYLLTAGTVALGWWTSPRWWLAAFLSFSALHFGLSDTVEQENDRRWAVPAWGGAPIIIPALAHPGEVAELFAALVGAAGAEAVSLLRGLPASGWAMVAVVHVARSVTRNERPGRSVLEFAAMCAGFALLPPLLAFAIYFGMLHAPRALATRAAELELSPRRLFRLAAGPSIAAALAALAVYLVLSTTMPSVDAAMTALFVGLAALTVPHMLLDVIVARVTQGRVHGEA